MKEFYIFIDEERNKDCPECEVFATKDEALTYQANRWFFEKLQKADSKKVRFDVGMIRYSDERWAQALKDDGSCFDDDEEDEAERARALASTYDYDEPIYTLADLTKSH